MNRGLNDDLSRILTFVTVQVYQSLVTSLSELLPNGVEDPGYFFFGYYMKKENVHMQPLSKLVQDMVEVLRVS